MNYLKKGNFVHKFSNRAKLLLLLASLIGNTDFRLELRSTEKKKKGDIVTHQN